MRVWVPGCSTGEEAYSLAMLFQEHIDQTQTEIKVQIFATDIDNGAIETARAGLYPHGIAVDVQPGGCVIFLASRTELIVSKKMCGTW